MEVYEFKLEELDKLEGFEVIEDSEEQNQKEKYKNISNSNVRVDVLIGKSKQTIKEILNLSVGDIIRLDKNIDEKLGIYVNDNKIANGESIILDNRIAVRVSEAESESEN